MSPLEKFFKNPVTGKFGGSPFSLLIVSTLAFYFAFTSVHSGQIVLGKNHTSVLLYGESPGTFKVIVLVCLVVGIGALWASWVSWKKHDDR